MEYAKMNVIINNVNSIIKNVIVYVSFNKKIAQRNYQIIVNVILNAIQKLVVMIEDIVNVKIIVTGQARKIIVINAVIKT